MGSDALLTPPTAERPIFSFSTIALPQPPGTSKAPSSIGSGVSAQARANKLAMERRMAPEAQDMRSTLVKRTDVRRTYRKKKHKKKKLRPMTAAEEELALLEPLEFVSKKPHLCCFGHLTFTELHGPGAAACRLFHLPDRHLRRVKRLFDSIDSDESGTITQNECERDTRASQRAGALYPFLAVVPPDCAPLCRPVSPTSL